MTYENVVVVAVDEGRPNRTVLNWAAAEAASRGLRLVVCNICEWQQGEHDPRPTYEDGDRDLRIGPQRAVGEALDLIRAGYPELRVSGAIGTGSPARALLRLSRQTAMIVLGAHGLGGFRGLLMGSVSGQVAEHASCPVAVVRPVAGSATDVVVGVDGSDGSARALRLGLTEARRTGGTLVALHVYQVPPVAAAPYAPGPGVNVISSHELAARTLDELLGTIEAENPDVKIEHRVDHGPPARVLLEAAADAAALVVGARGLGGFSGLMAGSVSQQVLRHAHCPVLIAH